MLLRFGGYRLGCASGSWSDLVRVICRDCFWSACLGSFRGCMCYSIICCYHSGHTIFYVGAEDDIGSVDFVFSNHLVLIVGHFSFFAIGCVHHEVCHGG
jgi:hypothetical protein